MSKVLMVCIKFPPYFGGAAVQATYLAKELIARGVQVEFITDNDDLKSVQDTYNGMKVNRFSTFFKKDAKLKELIYIFRIFWFVLTHPEFKIIHFHSMRGMEFILFPLIKAMRRNVILKLTLVGYDDPMAFKKRKIGPLVLWGLTFVDRFAAISTRLRDLAVEAGVPAGKVRIIYNGTNTDRFSKLDPRHKAELKRKLNIPADAVVFFSVGKVEHRKGYDFLGIAWLDIKRKFPKSLLLLAGPGNDENNPYYKQLLDFNRVNSVSNVRFLGQIDNVDDYMNISDCFVFCSRTEGFGTVLIEAMSACVPVVAMNIPGVTEDIIKDERIGKICYDFDTAAFGRMVNEVMDYKNDAAIAEAAEKIRRDFKIERIADQYVGLYRELLGQRNEKN